MPTLSTRVSDGEFKAITEYANAAGLTVSDLIKKVLMHKICWLWIEHEDDEYFNQMYYVFPEGAINDDAEMAIFVNKFRKCVGIRPLKVGDF